MQTFERVFVEKSREQRTKYGHFTCITFAQYCILIAIPGLKITADTVANATNIFFLATKNSGLIMTSLIFLYVEDQ